MVKFEVDPHTVVSGSQTMAETATRGLSEGSHRPGWLEVSETDKTCTLTDPAKGVIVHPQLALESET